MHLAFFWATFSAFMTVSVDPLNVTPPSSIGTLVVAVPLKEGLIVAADTRATIGGTYCDIDQKIIVPNSIKHTVAAITGLSKQYESKKDGQPDCEYYRSAPRRFDLQSALKTFLESYEGDESKINLETLAQLTSDEVARTERLHPGSFAQFIGKDMLAIVLAQYNPQSRRSVIRRLLCKVASDGNLSFSYDIDITRGPNDPPDLFAFGESDFLNRRVFSGEGRKKYVDETIMDLLRKRTSIEEVSANDARSVAVHAIEATARAAKSEQISTGVGGAINVALIGHSKQTMLQ